MEIELVVGDSAIALMNDVGFKSEWATLYDDCAWGTSFQRWDFTSCWWDFYGDRFTPVTLFARAPGGQLVGLLQLALEKKTGRLVGAGDIHAEYQCWLAPSHLSDAFIVSCLERLARARVAQALRLTYVPAETSLKWTDSREWRRRIHMRPAERMLVRTEDPEVVRDLKKKATRYKIKQFSRIGAEVSFERVTDLATFDSISSAIADLCDFRQSSVNGSTPFRSDPKKLPFHRALAVRTTLLHTTLMKSGEQVISVQLNMHNRDQVLLCVLGHDPRLSRWSPGHVHMLMLAQHLASEGIATFDLSPDGRYKERLATNRDLTHAIQVDLSAVAALRSLTRRSLTNVARKALTDPQIESIKGVRSILQAAQRSLFAGRPAHAVEALKRLSGRKIVQGRVFTAPVASIATTVGGGRNQSFTTALADMLSFHPSPTDSLPDVLMLRSAARLLSSGATCYTHVGPEGLDACVWLLLNEVSRASLPLCESPLLLPAKSAWLDRIWCRDDANSVEACRGALRLAITDAFVDGKELVYGIAFDEDLHVQSILESEGFKDVFPFTINVHNGRFVLASEIPVPFAATTSVEKSGEGS